MIGLVLQNDDTVRVFTDDKKYISQDIGHFTRSGTKYFTRIKLIGLLLTDRI